MDYHGKLDSKRLMDAMISALRGLDKLPQYLPTHPFSISGAKRAAIIKVSGPARAFFL